MNVLYWASEHHLLLCLMTGAAGSCIWLWLLRDRLQIAKWMIPVLALLNTAAGVICVRVFAGLESWGSPLSGGQSLFGGVFLLPVFYFAGSKLFRRRFGDVTDVFAMCTVTTLVFARVSCIISGCCQGSFLPGSESLRWPTREMEIIFHIVLLIVLYRKNRKGDFPGEIWPLYMFSYGIFRFLEEWMREGEQVFGSMHRGHIWAILSIIAGAAIYAEIHIQNKARSKSAGRRKDRKIC